MRSLHTEDGWGNSGYSLYKHMVGKHVLQFFLFSKYVEYKVRWIWFEGAQYCHAWHMGEYVNQI